MSKELFKSNINDIEILSTSEKKNLKSYCDKAVKDIEKKKGTPSKISIDVSANDSYKIEIIAKRKRNYKYSTAEDKLRAIGLEKSNETELIEKISKGEINNNHITNITKANIDNSITKLPTESQNLLIKKIIKNTNEKHLINMEEIASESIKNDNINLINVENWYKGILRACNQLESKLYINEEIVKFLSEEQFQELNKKITNINIKCELFLKSFN